MSNETVLLALRTRCLAWWRYMQHRKLMKHPQRFKAWRWEQQLVDFFGEVEGVFVDDDKGWMLLAQNRAAWRDSERAFSLF